VAEVKSYLEREGISMKNFACQLLDFLPDSAKYIQGTKQERECTRAWEIQIYRHLAGEITPRKDRLIAYSNWLNDQLSA